MIKLYLQVTLCLFYGALASLDLGAMVVCWDNNGHIAIEDADHDHCAEVISRGDCHDHEVNCDDVSIELSDALHISRAILVASDTHLALPCSGFDPSIYNLNKHQVLAAWPPPLRCSADVRHQLGIVKLLI